MALWMCKQGGTKGGGGSLKFGRNVKLRHIKNVVAKIKQQKMYRLKKGKLGEESFIFDWKELLLIILPSFNIELLGQHH